MSGGCQRLQQLTVVLVPVTIATSAVTFFHDGFKIVKNYNTFVLTERLDEQRLAFFCCCRQGAFGLIGQGGETIAQQIEERRCVVQRAPTDQRKFWLKQMG